MPVFSCTSIIYGVLLHTARQTGKDEEKSTSSYYASKKKDRSMYHGTFPVRINREPEIILFGNAITSSASIDPFRQQTISPIKMYVL